MQPNRKKGGCPDCTIHAHKMDYLRGSQAADPISQHIHEFGLTIRAAIGQPVFKMASYALIRV